MAGFVSYGALVEYARRAIAFGHGRVKGCNCIDSVQLSLYTDFENFTKFKPAPFQENAVNTMLEEVIAWGSALKELRTKIDVRA